MNTDTGEIYRLARGEQPRSEKDVLLTNDEARYLIELPERERPKRYNRLQRRKSRMARRLKNYR